MRVRDANPEKDAEIEQVVLRREKSDYASRDHGAENSPKRSSIDRVGSSHADRDCPFVRRPVSNEIYDLIDRPGEKSSPEDELLDRTAVDCVLPFELGEGKIVGEDRTEKRNSVRKVRD